MRESTRESLKRLGYTVETCADGARAVEAYRAHGERFDIVILDVVLPKVGGKEVFRAMREANPNARVVVHLGLCAEGRGGGDADAQIEPRSYRSP